MHENPPSYFRPEWITPTQRRLRADACVYGATAAGVIAAVTLARRGHRVALLQPGGFIGGMTTGGLGWTDFGRKHTVGGLARQFYRDLGTHYGEDETWRFEPHVATAVLQRYLDDADIQPQLYQYLDRADMADGRIASLYMLGGLRVDADYFLDATYEGDLLAAAGVSYTTGREPNARYGERLNGIQVRDQPHQTHAMHHQFDDVVDPYRIEGDPDSGLLPGILAEDLSLRQGEGDHRIQAYNFRICATDDPSLKIDWPKPAGYDPDDYVLLERWLHSEKNDFNEQLMDESNYHTPIRKFDVLPHRTANGYRKTDTNNHGAVSSDFIGGSQGWPEGDYSQREQIFQAHVRYQMGLYYHTVHSSNVPQRYRDAYAQWGLAGDEFEQTGHWPHQLYVREARRMLADHVITEHDAMHRCTADDSVGLASYTVDSHNTTRFVKVADGRARVMNEGNVEEGPAGPFGISYRCTVPARGQCENLLVPICLSASHIAYGSARMEPVFMGLGQSLAIAASLCLDSRCAVQDLGYDELQPELTAAGQVLEAADAKRAKAADRASPRQLLQQQTRRDRVEV